MARRYIASVQGVTEGTATDNTLWPMLWLPLANTTGLVAELDTIIICGSDAAPADIAMRMQLGVTSVANVAGGGTQMPTLGAGAGLGQPVDGSNSRPAAVGAGGLIKHTGSGALSTYARKLGNFPFNHKYPLILTATDLKDFAWIGNEVMHIETAHGSGSAAKLLSITVIWKE